MPAAPGLRGLLQAILAFLLHGGRRHLTKPLKERYEMTSTLQYDVRACVFDAYGNLHVDGYARLNLNMQLHFIAPETSQRERWIK